MKKLRIAMVGALLTLPAFAQDLGTTTADEPSIRIETTQSSGWCWVYMVGRWYLLPC